MCSAWNQILHLSAASSCHRLQASCCSFPPWFWQSPLMGRSFHLQGCGTWKGASPSEGATKGKIIRYFACGVVQDYARIPDASIMARNRWQEQLRVLPLRLIHRLMCNFADHWCEEALPSPCEGPRRGCPGQHKRVMPKQHDLIVKNPSPSTDPSMWLRFLIFLIFLRLSMMVWRCSQERPFSPQLSSVRALDRRAVRRFSGQLRSLRQSASAFTSALRDAFSHQMEHRRGSDLRDLDFGFLNEFLWFWEDFKLLILTHTSHEISASPERQATFPYWRGYTHHIFISGLQEWAPPLAYNVVSLQASCQQLPWPAVGQSPRLVLGETHAPCIPLSPFFRTSSPLFLAQEDMVLFSLQLWLPWTLGKAHQGHPNLWDLAVTALMLAALLVQSGELER